MISFKSYKKELGSLNDDELLVLATLVDEVAYQVMIGAREGGSAGAIEAYQNVSFAVHDEVGDFIEKRHERIAKKMK